MIQGPASAKREKIKRLFRWGGGILAIVLAVLFLGTLVAAGPLRTYLERRMNQALIGYSASLSELDLHFPTFALTLKGLILRQKAHPEPPVARIPQLHASVHWYEIFFGRLVAEFEVETPQLHIDLTQLKEEARSKTPVEERGWQEAVQAIYPLKINRLAIKNGQLTYIDKDPDRPLTMSSLYLFATNIRNIHSPRDVFPSPFNLRSDLFGKGRILVDGKADFLAEPRPAVQASVELENVPLSELDPLAHRANLFIDQGQLSAAGQMIYTPEIKKATLEKLQISGMKLDYVHSPDHAELIQERIHRVEQATRRIQEKEDLELQANKFLITESEFGFVNEFEDPAYRLFISDARVVLSNYSDNFRQGPASARLNGNFMGSGATSAVAVFRPAKKGSNFDLDVEIKKTNLAAMNDLLRAYGNFDVTGGLFSLYSEIQVRGHAISGYVKPLFEDMEVYSGKQEEGEGVLQKAYEGIVGGVSELLENPQEDVATKADISGTVENPEASTLEIILNLLQNAFFGNILPGLEQEMSRLEKKDNEKND